MGRGIHLISGLKWANVQNRSGCGGYHLQNVGDQMQSLLPCLLCNHLIAQLINLIHHYAQETAEIAAHEDSNNFA